MMNKFLGGLTMLCNVCKQNSANLEMKAFSPTNNKIMSFHICNDCLMQGKIALSMPVNMVPIPININNGTDNPDIENIENIIGNFPWGMLTNALMGQLSANLKNMQAGNKDPAKPAMRCPDCGMEFDTCEPVHLIMGCASCYRLFSEKFASLFSTIHAGARHEGKFPKKFGTAQFHKREVTRLRGLLQNAVAIEDFEEAARLRDLVRDLETV